MYSQFMMHGQKNIKKIAMFEVFTVSQVATQYAHTYTPSVQYTAKIYGYCLGTYRLRSTHRCE